MDELDLVGKTLGPYQILAEVGRGGMAIVYRAFQPSLNRVVAIKVLPPSLTLDREFVDRFVREAQAAASLRHPNILVVHDVAQQAGLHYIAMEYLEGKTLGDTIRQEGGLPPDRVAHIARQVASALDYAHQRGVVHRDIKPSNIFIGPGDHVTLTDFGIAKAAGGTALTRTGTVMGTPQYMAPEQAEAGTAGGEADQYALAIVVYEMLTGRVPFQADSPHAVLYKQVHEPPPALPGWRTDLPAAWNQVLSRALAKDPQARYPSAGAFAKALAGALRGRAPAAREPVPAPAPRGRAPAGRRAPPAPQVQRRRVPTWMWVAIAVVALSLIGLSASLLLRPKGEAGIPVARTTGAAPTTALAAVTTSTPRPALATTPAALPPVATTPAIVPTPTRTPTPSATPPPTASPTPTLTPSPSPTPPCAIGVDAQLAPAWIRSQLGCPTANPAVVWAAWEPFEHGYMLWRSDTDWAYVFYWRNPSAGDWVTGGNEWKWDGSFPDGRGLNPPPGLFEPIRGFGYVWYNFAQGGGATAMGWATEPEKGFCANVQPFEKGFMFHSSTVQYCEDEYYNWATDPSFTPLFFTLRADGTWTRY